MAAKRGATEAGLNGDSRPSKVSKNEEEPTPMKAKRGRKSEAQLFVRIPETAGTVFVQGINDFGQLGVEKSFRKFCFPVETLEGKDIVAVEAGLLHSLVLTREGVVYTCGQNDEGVLGREGNNKDEGEREYRPIDSSNIVAPVARVAGGGSHSACIDTLGNLYIWGCYRNASGLFGKTGGSTENLLGVDTPKLLSEVGKVRHVASGLHHTAAITVSNTVVTWGCGEAGQLGRLGERVISRGNRKENSQLNPRPVTLPLTTAQRKNKVVPVQLSLGGYHSMCVMSDGSLFGWGLNNCGQLGTAMEPQDEDEKVDEDDPKIKDVIHSPVRIESIGDLAIVQVACGDQHTLVLTKEGHVYAFGRNSFHNLGLGSADENPHCVPERVNGDLEGQKVIQICSMQHICFAIDEKGTVYSWGMGSTKAIATNEEDDIKVPTRMAGGRIQDRKMLSIACGSMHAVCLVGGDKTGANEKQ